ncbi:hypothetical protein ACVWWU_002209 [Pantoea sp. PA1]|jgi:hypothetical protein|uniref:hypothetical protein n=1 Tax=Pantoea ananas TaxID=553 RepID=UPI000D5C73D9|nr:hypothetical protein [Pantoea ananatis]MDH0052974.1 hypothetical protein [Pantoea ananatis]PVY86002.1 hypothetical protein C7427_103561 [Pantoea ananatis]
MSNVNLSSFSKSIFFVLFFALCIYICWTPLFHSKLWLGHDSYFHIYRALATVRDFKSGQYPPLWDLENYGHAINVFYPPALNYLLSFSFLFTKDILVGEKVVVIFIALLTTMTTYFLFYKNSKNKILSFTFSLLFSSSIYMVDNLFIRSAYPESMAIAAIPLMFLGLFSENKGDSFKFLILSNSFFILTNIPMALCSGIYFLLYYVIYRRLMREYILSLVISLIVCSWYVFPMLYSYFHENLNISANWFPIMTERAITAYDLISGEKIKPGLILAGMSLGIGFPLFFAFIYSVFKSESGDKRILFLIASLAIIICSGFDYTKLPSFLGPLSSIQFSWRFVPFLTLSILFFVFSARVVNFKAILVILLATSATCSSFNSLSLRENDIDTTSLRYFSKDYFPRGVSDVHDVECYSKGVLKPASYTKKINSNGLPSYSIDVEDKSNCIIPFISYKGLKLTGTNDFIRDGYFKAEVPAGHSVLNIIMDPTFRKLTLLSTIISIISISLCLYLLLRRVKIIKNL